MSAVWVFIGGGLGSLLRYFIGQAFAKTTIALPIATLLSNIISCIIFALALVFLNERLQTQPNVKLFLLTGICGGLSTFSTFSYETINLFKQGDYVWASSNILVSLLLCLIIFSIFMVKIN